MSRAACSGERAGGVLDMKGAGVATTTPRLGEDDVVVCVRRLAAGGGMWFGVWLMRWAALPSCTIRESRLRRTRVKGGARRLCSGRCDSYKRPELGYERLLEVWRGCGCSR
ncbi:hypothetical protein C8Q74DRAFT_1296637 [Fomes fomentarius]|nr:hypothetical protein C8Q74DRAFT_1296637 [Fomes fomentarius]